MGLNPIASQYNSASSQGENTEAKEARGVSARTRRVLVYGRQQSGKQTRSCLPVRRAQMKESAASPVSQRLPRGTRRVYGEAARTQRPRGGSVAQMSRYSRVFFWSVSQRLAFIQFPPVTFDNGVKMSSRILSCVFSSARSRLSPEDHRGNNPEDKNHSVTTLLLARNGQIKSLKYQKFFFMRIDVFLCVFL